MASVQTWSIRDHERDRATEDADEGGSRSGFTPYGQRFTAFQPKGDPLTQLLDLEELALSEGFANVAEYKLYLNSTQGSPCNPN
jgi:hypothetical protein